MTRLPIVAPSLRSYQRAWLRPDLIAGATVWAVLVPESLAYASIAGVSPVVGLYAAAPALILYAVLGSSRHLVVGPMSATAALSAGVVGTLVAPSSAEFVGLTSALAIIGGLVALAAGLLRLGFLANFISEPVLKGFIIGLALTIVIGQLPKLFGVKGSSGNFFEKLVGLIKNLGHTNLPTLIVAIGSLAVVLALKRWLPVVPASLVAVVLGVAAVYLFKLDQHGVEIVGQIKAGLPRFGLPQGLALHRYLDLVGPAFSVIIVGFAEGLGAAKTYAARAGYDVDANRELLGLGLANLGAGLSSGMVVNGSLSKTAVNGAAGAKSQVSGLSAAVLTVITLLFLTGLFEKLPEATLGAIVVTAVIELIDVKSLRRLYAVQTRRLSRIYGPASRADFAAAVGAILGVLLFDTLPGLIIGIVLSLLLLLYRSSRIHVAELGRNPDGLWLDKARTDDVQDVPEVAVLRVEGGLFFGNAEAVRTSVRTAAADTRGVVLDCETVPFVDVTAAEMLVRLSTDLSRQHTQLALARDIGQVRDVIRATGESTELTIYPSVDTAIAAIRDAPSEDRSDAARPDAAGPQRDGGT